MISDFMIEPFFGLWYRWIIHIISTKSL